MSSLVLLSVLLALGISFVLVFPVSYVVDRFYDRKNGTKPPVQGWTAVWVERQVVEALVTGVVSYGLAWVVMAIW